MEDKYHMEKVVVLAPTIKIECHELGLANGCVEYIRNSNYVTITVTVDGETYSHLLHGTADPINGLAVMKFK